MSLTIQGSPTALEFLSDDRPLATYVFRPELPIEESPKPYFHPLRSLAGVPVTDFRPADHPWHKGLQMTLTDASGNNFWGGPTYDADTAGYVWKPNVGGQVHGGFAKCSANARSIEVVESLTWTTATSDSLIDERRELTVFGIDERAGSWALEFSSTLSNLSAAPLVLGSPATLGRVGVGYSGLFWRGPASWTGVPVSLGAGIGRGPMGAKAGWVAMSGPVSSSHRASGPRACVVTCRLRGPGSFDL